MDLDLVKAVVTSQILGTISLAVWVPLALFFFVQETDNRLGAFVLGLVLVVITVFTVVGMCIGPIGAAIGILLCPSLAFPGGCILYGIICEAKKAWAELNVWLWSKGEKPVREEPPKSPVGY